MSCLHGQNDEPNPSPDSPSPHPHFKGSIVPWPSDLKSCRPLNHLNAPSHVIKMLEIGLPVLTLCTLKQGAGCTKTACHKALIKHMLCQFGGHRRMAYLQDALLSELDLGWLTWLPGSLARRDAGVPHQGAMIGLEVPPVAMPCPGARLASRHRGHNLPSHWVRMIFRMAILPDPLRLEPIQPLKQGAPCGIVSGPLQHTVHLAREGLPQPFLTCEVPPGTGDMLQCLKAMEIHKRQDVSGDVRGQRIDRRLPLAMTW